jgi:hypothetical protein
MELKLSMQCCMAIDLSESTECSEIAAKNRDLHHPIMVVDYFFCTKLMKKEYILKSSPLLGFWNEWEKF